MNFYILNLAKIFFPRQRFFSVCVFSFFLNNLEAQTALFSENFETGGGSFTLNTTDMSSMGTSGNNKFVINNSYAGGQSAVSCFGIPFSFTVPNTSSQPLGITSNPNSFYLHTLSNVAEDSSIFNCCFQAPDGFCINSENYFSKMNADISTAGFTNVTFSFWWLCSGSSGNYGEVYYSVDGGNIWNLLSNPFSQYYNQTTWIQTTITTPAFDNNALLRFGFRFVNQVSLTATDPGFGVDDISITGMISTLSLSTDSASGSPFCPGEIFTVKYTATGSFNPGNIFTAELSDSLGNFSNPVSVGSVTSVTSGSINATIPVSAPTGNGYRVRVTSSNPAMVSVDNGVDLAVATVPFVLLGTLADVCQFDEPFPMYGGSPAGGDYLGGNINNNIFDPAAAGLGTHNIIYTFSDLNGCSDSALNKITVNPTPEASFSGLAENYCTDDAPINLVGSPSGGTFLGNGITGNVFDPESAGSGIASIRYIFINQQNCSDTATANTTVNICSGIADASNNFQFSVLPKNSSIFIVSFFLESRFPVRLKVIDSKGSFVKELLNVAELQGKYSMEWNRQGLDAGIYILLLEAGEFSCSKKILITN